MKTIPFFLITDVCIKKEVTPLEFPLLDNVERSFLKINDYAIYARFCIFLRYYYVSLIEVRYCNSFDSIYNDSTQLYSFFTFANKVPKVPKPNTYT